MPRARRRGDLRLRVAPASVSRFFGFVAAELPRGRLLPDAAWDRRHRWIVTLVALHSVGLAVFAIERGFGVAHSLLEAGLVAAAAIVASRPRLSRTVRSVAASFGLVTSSALLVHLTQGNIEAHFHFFFVLSVLILYQDWLPFLLAILYVVVHHGVVGVIDPDSVYNHADAIEHPWRWALVHGGFVVATSAASVVSWRVNEQLLHEPLTGLPGRAVFVHRVNRAIEDARRDKQVVAVLFLDLDRFKLLNDNLGHAAGDRLLIAAAARIRAAVRSRDVVARLGGDEFAILCEDLDGEEEAVRVADRILASLAAPLTLDGAEVAPLASIGIAFARSDGSRAESLVADADVAMYRAKEQGDRYVLFGDEMRREELERLELEITLRRAVERDELRVHYQPIVSIADGDVVGVEALLRWQHPERGLVQPAAFVPVAEQTGLIVPIGAWVLREACREATRWVGSPDAPYVSVNLSPRQVADRAIVATVKAALEESGLEPHRLALEITESILLDEEDAPATLASLKELGVSVVLDDFGTGYSSLSYLTRFPIDALKVDRSFVANLGRSAEDDAIVSAIAGMARALGVTFVAEGVETERQLRTLQLLGFKFAQGYHFARPRPEDQLGHHIRPAAPVEAPTASGAT